jgi:microsomal dipeptidase-like Zn-dependent dipeptidase
LCFGCDFDGIGSLPNGIDDISDLENLYFCIEKQFGKEIANKIFFENAYAFTVKNILD